MSEQEKSITYFSFFEKLKEIGITINNENRVIGTLCIFSEKSFSPAYVVAVATRGRSIFESVTFVTDDFPLNKSTIGKLSQICKDFGFNDGESMALMNHISRALYPPKEWSRRILFNLMKSLFEKKFFDLSIVYKIANSLNSVRASMGIQRHEYTNEIVINSLRAIHCDDYPEMDADTRNGIKAAVWDYCGLDEDIGMMAFGEYWDQVKGFDVITEDIADRKAIDSTTTDTPTKDHDQSIVSQSLFCKKSVWFISLSLIYVYAAVYAGFIAWLSHH